MSLRDAALTVKLEFGENEEPTFKILFPMGSRQLTIRQSANLLAGAICMLMKAKNLTDFGIKDHELLREMITHLETEFASAESYMGITLNPAVFLPENYKNAMPSDLEEE